MYLLGTDIYSLSRVAGTRKSFQDIRPLRQSVPVHVDEGRNAFSAVRNTFRISWL